MIEKLKDILYDLSDIVVSLIIIALIFFSVSWKISDTLDVNLKDALTNTPESSETESNIPVTVVIPDINNPSGTGDNTPADNTQTPDTAPNGETSQPQNTSDGETTPGETAPTNTTPSETTPADNSTPANNTPPATAPTNGGQTALQTFIVADGATGYSIGKKLVEEGYVSDVNEFVNRLVAMKLDNKLRAGEFKLSKSDDLDTIIKVLAGQGR